MRTIPASWQTGSSRDEWYNNRGTPLLFVRIQKLTGGYLRLSNKQTLFTEEGGVKYLYDSKYYKSLSTIETALNFMQGWAGAIGQMGQTSIIINNGEIGGTKFTDLYDLDDLINAKVDIYFVPEESGDISISNSLKQYKGVITNYKMTSATLTLQINDYSNIDHKNIPMRYDEFNEVQSLGWSVPNQNKGRVMPICFGEGIFKAPHCDTTDNGTRYYWISYDYKNSRISYRTVLYYWEADEKRFKVVDTALWTEYDRLGTDLQVIRFDVTDLAIYNEMANYLIPDSISYVYYSGYPSAVDKDKLADKAKAITGDASYTNQWLLTQGQWKSVYQLKFLKSQFDLRGNFDLYVVADIAYLTGSQAKRWETRFSCYLLGGLLYATQDQAMYDDDGGTPPYFYCAWIPNEWINEGYNPNETVLNAGLIKKNLKPDDLSDILWLSIQHKALTNPITSTPVYTFEVSLMQVMLSLPREFYVKDNFSNNIIDDAINELFTTHLNISSDNIVYENFNSEYKIDGQIYEEIDSYDLFSKLANEFGIIFYEDEDGKERFIDITPIDPVYEITDNDVIMGSNGQLALSVERTAKEVFSSFYVDYRKNLATGDYEASKYVTKDNHNLVHIDAINMKLLCYNAYQDYNTEKRMSVKLDFVRDGETAERILGKLVQFYSKKRKVVRFRSSLRIIDLEKGDQLTVNTSVFSSIYNYYVVGKTINYEAKTIEWTLLESPWVGAGVSKVISDEEAINEATYFHTGIMVDEEEAINENVVHHLEIP